MRILLATPLYASHYDAGHFWLRALTALGHEVYVWDYRLDNEPPIIDYPDLVLVMKGESVDATALRRELPDATFFCYWPDRFERDPGVRERLLEQYDHVFTPVRPTPEGFIWLPTGWDKKIHLMATPRGSKQLIGSIYIGTANSQYKTSMVRDINPQFVFGNGWPNPPVYGQDLAAILSRAKVAVDIHQAPDAGVNRKIFEMMACALTIVDDVPGIQEILGPELSEKVVYKNAAQARYMIDHYIRADTEREALRQQELLAIAPYTYEAAAKLIVRLYEDEQATKGWDIP